MVISRGYMPQRNAHTGRKDRKDFARSPRTCRLLRQHILLSRKRRFTRGRLGVQLVVRVSFFFFRPDYTWGAVSGYRKPAASDCLAKHKIDAGFKEICSWNGARGP